MKFLSRRFSLLQQWVGATFLAILPLLVAVSYAALELQQQTQRQRQLVQDMDQLSNSNLALSDDVKELVRSARQYLLLRDTRFLAIYRQKNASLKASAAKLKNQLPEANNHRWLEEMATTADEVDGLLVGDIAPSQAELSLPLQNLVSLNEQLTQGVNRHRREVVETGESEFNRIVDQLFVLTMMALPGTFLLMMIGTFMVSRPLWRLSQAIGRLGRQEWETPIAITGPADLMALGDSLEWMRQQVCASDRQKTAFSQHVTHELKTPLAAIIEAANLLKDGVPVPLLKEQQPVVDILIANARNLQDLIQQLINYNTVSHGLVTHCQNINIRQYCETVQHSLESANPNLDVNWRFQGGGDSVYCDPRLLDMILRNLMGNAFQFCAPGGTIAITWARRDQCWQLKVVDDGPGIEENELQHIFTPFYKGRTGRQSKVPKNGIGLAIVKESVSLLKGRIQVHSQPGKGATFEIQFPLIQEA
jgi:two-component system sensor histidine kinase GlrK